MYKEIDEVVIDDDFFVKEIVVGKDTLILDDILDLYSDNVISSDKLKYVALKI
jgi:hypothetical protein